MYVLVEEKKDDFKECSLLQEISNPIDCLDVQAVDFDSLPEVPEKRPVLLSNEIKASRAEAARVKLKYGRFDPGRCANENLRLLSKSHMSVVDAKTFTGSNSSSKRSAQRSFDGS